jgi:hypothetical protein
MPPAFPIYPGGSPTQIPDCGHFFPCESQGMLPTDTNCISKNDKADPLFRNELAMDVKVILPETTQDGDGNEQILY